MEQMMLSGIIKKDHDIRLLRFSNHISLDLAHKLIEFYPRLQRVSLTACARKRMANRTKRLFFQRQIEITVSSGGRGRPVEFPRSQLTRLIALRSKSLSYRKIARLSNLSISTVYRALTESTRFHAWREDFNSVKTKKASGIWLVTRDADPKARILADRHYSRKTKGATFFCGPGEKLVLLTPDKKALFVWRRNKIRWDGQRGIECSIFRNEGTELSSNLINSALRHAKKKWPQESRFFTYVDPRAVRSRIPGYCFRKAGWTEAGISKDRKLVLLEKIN